MSEPKRTIHEITIGEDKFAITEPGAWASFALQEDIIPALADGFAQLGGSGNLLEQDITSLGRAVSAAFQRLGRGVLVRVTHILLSSATMNGKALFSAAGSGKADAFDVLMRGRTFDTWALIWFALKDVWYPDLPLALARMKKAADEARAIAARDSPSKGSNT